MSTVFSGGPDSYISRRSYLKAYEMVRDITGTGDGNGPMLTIHDGFTGTSNWAGFLSGADRLALGAFVSNSMCLSHITDLVARHAPVLRVQLPGLGRSSQHIRAPTVFRLGPGAEH